MNCSQCYGSKVGLTSGKFELALGSGDPLFPDSSRIFLRWLMMFNGANKMTNFSYSVNIC